MRYPDLDTLHGLLWEFRLFLEADDFDPDIINSIADVSEAVERVMRIQYQDENSEED
jgi:hypothetical protein